MPDADASNTVQQPPILQLAAEVRKTEDRIARELKRLSELVGERESLLVAEMTLDVVNAVPTGGGLPIQSFYPNVTLEAAPPPTIPPEPVGGI